MSNEETRTKEVEAAIERRSISLLISRLHGLWNDPNYNEGFGGHESTEFHHEVSALIDALYEARTCLE